MSLAFLCSQQQFYVKTLFKFLAQIHNTHKSDTRLSEKLFKKRKFLFFDF